MAGQAVAAALTRPEGVAVDKTGALYIADTQNGRIRKVTPDGIISTFAGGGASGFAGEGVPATAASAQSAIRIAVDVNGNVVFSDRGNHTVRRVTSGVINTVEANGTRGVLGAMAVRPPPL
jgi:sugar lactone lactonase YvrE